METVLRRILQLAGLLLIGDALRGLIAPRGRSLFWHLGPELVKAASEELSEHRKTARTFHLAEAALGIALAMRARTDAN